MKKHFYTLGVWKTAVRLFYARWPLKECGDFEIYHRNIKRFGDLIILQFAKCTRDVHTFRMGDFMLGVLIAEWWPDFAARSATSMYVHSPSPACPFLHLILAMPDLNIAMTVCILFDTFGLLCMHIVHFPSGFQRCIPKARVYLALFHSQCSIIVGNRRLKRTMFRMFPRFGFSSPPAVVSNIFLVYFWSRCPDCITVSSWVFQCPIPFASTARCHHLSSLTSSDAWFTLYACLFCIVSFTVGSCWPCILGICQARPDYAIVHSVICVVLTVFGLLLHLWKELVTRLMHTFLIGTFSIHCGEA